MRLISIPTVILLAVTCMSGCTKDYFVQPQTRAEVVIPPQYVGWWEAISRNAYYTYIYLSPRGDYQIAVPKNFNLAFDPDKNIQYKSKQNVKIVSKEKNKIHLITIGSPTQEPAAFTLTLKDIHGLESYLSYEDSESMISYKRRQKE